MKKVISLVLVALFVCSVAFAGQVNGYYRKNGTYVQPYVRSNSNNTVTDNYSFKGNTNPYTGKTGTNLYKNSSSSPYYNPSYNANSGSRLSNSPQTIRFDWQRK